MITRILDLSSTLKKKSLFLFGPRQTGKTTFLTHTYPDAYYINLLNTQLQIELLSEPYRIQQMIETRKKTDLVIIDEIQKVPAILDEIQNLIQTNPSMRFILTGSSARKIKKAGVNLLGGRAKIIRFSSLVYPEIKKSKIPLSKVIQWGGLPHVVLSDNPKEELLDYINVFLREEIKAESLVRSLAQFSKFLDLAATTVSEQIVYDSLCSDVGVSAPTIKEYFQILEDTLIGFRLSPYTKSIKRKAMTSCKFYLFDTGVGNVLLKRFSLHEKTSEYGAAFEQYLFHELSAFINYCDPTSSLYYWRSYDKYEVDFVIEKESGELILIESKSTNKISDKHLAGIFAFSEEKKSRVIKKIIVCNESSARIVNKDILIMPLEYFLEALWNKKI